MEALLSAITHDGTSLGLRFSGVSECISVCSASPTGFPSASITGIDKNMHLNKLRIDWATPTDWMPNYFRRRRFQRPARKFRDEQWDANRKTIFSLGRPKFSSNFLAGALHCFKSISSARKWSCSLRFSYLSPKEGKLRSSNNQPHRLSFPPCNTSRAFASSPSFSPISPCSIH